MDARFADAVIVAAGASRRMAGIDKLTQPLLDRPLLAWSLESMAGAESVDRIVIVGRPDQVELLRAAHWLANAADGRAVVVSGGERRSDSVRAGLAATRAEVVLVHDGARPLATSGLADSVARAAAEHGAAVPVVPVVDSLKRAAGGILDGSLDREGLVRTQTPQGARRQLLLDAFAAAGDAAYADEAALLEARGVTVATVPGEATNLKVTDQADLEVVRAIAAARHGTGGSGAGEIRFGFGEDTHGFGPGDGLALGGLQIAEAPRLYGHSDGDVVLHALATAMLAAAGLGDLGRLFLSSDPDTTGVASADLIREAVRRVSEAGWRVDRAQVSIVGGRPMLGGKRLDSMRDVIAGLVGVSTDAVAVTASTGNLAGPEGAGRVIRSTSLVTLIRR
jgi:2-C-methyl-D-erythritol 4-phosphate cytidylyltransferase / 2-C-methyl-D-erythritol 2,4-cyclodiphosphate synthase